MPGLTSLPTPCCDWEGPLCVRHTPLTDTRTGSHSDPTAVLAPWVFTHVFISRAHAVPGHRHPAGLPPRKKSAWRIEFCVALPWDMSASGAFQGH